MNKKNSTDLYDPLMSDNKKRKKRRSGKKDGARFGILIFYLGIVAFISATMIFINGLKDDITDYLQDYESNLPEHTVQAIFDEHFASPDFSKLLDLSGYTDSEFVSKQDIISYLEQTTAGKEITYVYVAGTSRSKINVKADGEKFASFTVEKENVQSKYGFDRYKLGQIDLFYQAREYITVKIPFNCTVSVNGNTLGEEYITKTDITDDARPSIPDGTYKFSYTEYKVSGFLTEPVVTVSDKNGNEVEGVYDSESKTYTVEFKYDDSFDKIYGDYVLEAMEKYACRMQNDATFNDCKKYFEPDTQLYANIKANPGSFVWEHDGYSFEDEWCGEYYMYDTGVIRCRVKFNHILHKKGKEDHPDPVDMTVYLRQTDGEYLIYAMETN